MRIFIRSLLAGGEIRRGYFVFPRAQKNKSRSGNHLDYGQCYNSYFHGHFSKRFFAFKNDTSIINNNNDIDINLVIRGHQIEFDVSRRIANLAESTIVGKNGETIALTTIATDTHPATDHNDSDIETTKGDHHSGYLKILGDSMKRICQHNNTSRMVPLTVEYRQRYHAVGKIPLSANRTDNRRQSDSEILASRAIDRSLRPLILLNDDEIMTLSSIHLTCSIQSYPIKEYNNGCGGGGGGHPVSLAINSASLAMNDRLIESVGAVVLCLTGDGTILIDPSIATIQGYQQQRLEMATKEEAKTVTSSNNNNKTDIIGELLYAGTKDSIVMMEFSGMLPESQIFDLIRFAHECIQPVIQIQEEKCKLMNTVKIERKKSQQHYFQSDTELRKQLGLDTQVVADVSSVKATTTTTTAPNNQMGENEIYNKANQIYDEAIELVKYRLTNTSLRLFGVQPDDDNLKNSSDIYTKKEDRKITIHSEATDGMLLGKAVRGRRENLVNEEIKRILRKEYHSMLHHDKSIINILGDTIHSQMLREAMKDASIKYKSRADGRGSKNSTNGCDTIRPLSMDVPVFSDRVHGSALFTRGETQVLCTTTLGPPKDGILHNDPYIASACASTDGPSNAGMSNLPVGSLRYLRSQEYLESDLNSRKVRADREQTGDSGTLRDRRRAFLQYDFPAYCTGEVQTGSSSISRREIGHGALAEKSILPILPPASVFPYAIRMTSEVTSSNGSSSMASVCGVTLSLLDAGVPITAPVAGVSVGLVKDGSNNSLLLDITGTEDHFGLMDFKVAGTKESITAFQMDVKKALPFTLIEDALNLAKEGRSIILEEMSIQSKISSKGDITDLSSRPEPKNTAPRSSVVTFDPSRKKDLLGPGGVVIRQMEDRFNVSLDLTQEGQCLLFGDDREMVRKAKAAVMDLVSDVEVGLTYEGIIIEIRDFGVIIELLRNKEGLCHVSELAEKEKIKKHPEGTLGLVNDLFNVGQKIDVVCTAVDPVQGTIRLRPASKKEAF
mmetsp:Transcript_9564/g.10989  ORF Transcript_9564/g.10989 Transcript_9564/m.10989 type:complete len:1011 (-) Transcript_9564:405-3437(-)